MHDHKGKNTLILDRGNVVLDFDVDRIVASLGLDQNTATQLRAQLFAHPDWINLDHGTRTEADERLRAELRYSPGRWLRAN